MGVRASQVLVRTPVGTLQINSPLVGRQNVYNILAAVATGLATTVRGQPVPLKARGRARVPLLACFQLFMQAKGLFPLREGHRACPGPACLPGQQVQVGCRSMQGPAAKLLEKHST